MDQNQIRQYIGNTNYVIIFTDNNIDISIELLSSFGKVNQIFIIVLSINDLYYIKIIHKEMETYPPYVPYNYLFAKKDIYDYILSKIYNGSIILKTKSAISNMFLSPRQTALDQINKNIYETSK